MTTIYFVCHGNICRSPAAEYIFKQLIEERRLSDLFEVDSFALTREEIGNGVYLPMKRALEKKGIPFGNHRAKLLTAADVEKADYIFYMDEENEWLIHRYFGSSSKFRPIYWKTSNIREIEDPWYTGRYDLVVRQIQECVENLLKELSAQH